MKKIILIMCLWVMLPLCGKAIDSYRTPGYVKIKNGVVYEIEASGTVTLEDGFKVEKGATFAVYPSCF